MSDVTITDVLEHELDLEDAAPAPEHVTWFSVCSTGKLKQSRGGTCEYRSEDKAVRYSKRETKSCAKQHAWETAERLAPTSEYRRQYYEKNPPRPPATFRAVRVDTRYLEPVGMTITEELEWCESEMMRFAARADALQKQARLGEPAPVVAEKPKRKRKSRAKPVPAVGSPTPPCDHTYVDFMGAARVCMPNGEGCRLAGCPGSQHPSGGW